MDVFEYGNPNASLILLQMIGDHDIEMIDHEFDLIQKAVSDELCLIACKVDDWNRDLSPWKAPAVFKSESFGENAAKTLSEVLTYIGEKKQPCIIGGYSLAGLFALWAATKTDRFSKVAAASPSVWFPGFTEYIKENNIKTVIPVSDKPVEIGNMTFKFYQPEKDFGNTNDNSLVTMLEYDEKRFLFTGDISSKREESMVNSDKELKCDVLKVAHHGSKYSSSEDFLAKASPETAVISVSADDTALPDYYITALLNSVCKNVYRTDSDKTVMITVENGEICTKTHA